MAASFFTHFIIDQVFRTPSEPTASFEGKTVIVTGANAGLGKEAARQIVALGASRTILAVRNTAKGEDAKRDIQASGGAIGNVEVWKLDLGSYESTRAFSERCNGLDRIDAVIENAGISTTDFEAVEDNESTITVNVVSTFLLLLLLLPKLHEVAKQQKIHPCVAVLVSELFEVAPLKARLQPSILAALNDPGQADMGNRYMDSKLLQVLYLQQLFKQQDERGSVGGVVINYVNPGFCHSELMRNQNTLAARTFKAVLARTTEQGARTHVHAAAAGPDSHGRYQCNGISKDISHTWPSSSEGREVAARVFKEVNEKLEGIVPGITKNI